MRYNWPFYQFWKKNPNSASTQCVQFIKGFLIMLSLCVYYVIYGSYLNRSNWNKYWELVKICLYEEYWHKCIFIWCKFVWACANSSVPKSPQFLAEIVAQFTDQSLSTLEVLDSNQLIDPFHCKENRRKKKKEA